MTLTQRRRVRRRALRTAAIRLRGEVGSPDDARRSAYGVGRSTPPGRDTQTSGGGSTDRGGRPSADSIASPTAEVAIFDSVEDGAP